MAPSPDEPRWTAATAMVPRFEFPHGRGGNNAGLRHGGSGGTAWDSSVIISLASLGVSLVDARPAEALYVRATGLSASAALTGTGDEVTLDIVSIQIDDSADDAEFPVVLCKAKSADAAAAAAPMLGISIVVAPNTGWGHLRSVRGRTFPIRVCTSTRFGVAAVHLFDGFQRALAATTPLAPYTPLAAACLDPLADGGFPNMRTEGEPAEQFANAAAATALATMHASCVRALIGGRPAITVAPSQLLLKLVHPSTASAAVFVEHFEPLGTSLSVTLDVRVSRDSSLDKLLGFLGVSPFYSRLMRTFAGLEFEGARLKFQLEPKLFVSGGPADLFRPVQAELVKQGVTQVAQIVSALKGFSASAAVLEVCAI